MFWGMTPRQFNYLVERFQERIKRDDHRAGEIIAMIYNANRDTDEDKNGLRWWDWFPQWKEEPPEQTEEEMFEIMQLFTAKNNEGLSH